MIFATIGTHCQFDRLVKVLDKIRFKADEFVVIQLTEDSYKPQYALWCTQLNASELDQFYKGARIIISHAGAGAIITALKYKKPIIVVPRQKRFGEHVDDHQLELARELSKEGLVTATTVGSLEKAMKICRKPRKVGERKLGLIKALRESLEEFA